VNRRRLGGPWAFPLTLAVALGLSSAGCGLLFEHPDPALSPSEGADAGDPAADTADLPVGMGTLRQAEVSILLRRGELQMRVTPLTESVIRVTAPDTYERLSALGRGHQRLFQERTGSAVSFQLFLVAVHAEAMSVSFEPEDLNLVSRGIRYRPVDIRPVTPRWDRHEVAPRETLMAVYAFPPEVDLEDALEVEYQEIRDRSWERILPRIEAERFRLRARPEGPTFREWPFDAAGLTPRSRTS
jgi:hypothetical protein